jgi:transcription antitermination factor NusA-like protein
VTEKKKQVKCTSPGLLQQLEEIAVEEFYSRKISVDHVVQNYFCRVHANPTAM